MWKPTLASFMFIFAFILSPASAGYDRNQAVPVEKVLYGDITSVRNITETQLIEDRNRGWKTFGGALAGGVIGNQFGGGSGRDVATILGALIGGGIGNRYGSGTSVQSLKLVELIINQEDGTQVMVIQDYDAGMVFNAGDRVRVVYLQGGVRVDVAM
ncbi:glycine zipper 2TM domain-containing protein [Shewanella sp. DAU305]|uniref:glycine zipper 2TM domain-containing protein n=1 Tax=Shewanella sp. DAU305 TaxID=2991940 RepID=UPI002283FABD|nr:glycine zipper 2TM domain-containing protein [Shewanella sp. DAU305]WAL76724.1 glycine zipper 2TM domain-containing protein [Shewanella sp. DAU305]